MKHAKIQAILTHLFGNYFHFLFQLNDEFISRALQNNKHRHPIQKSIAQR